MAENEKTSEDIASIAARGLKDPSSLTHGEIRSLCGSVLTQAPDDSKKPLTFLEALAQKIAS